MNEHTPVCLTHREGIPLAVQSTTGLTLTDRHILVADNIQSTSYGQDFLSKSTNDWKPQSSKHVSWKEVKVNK